MDSLLKFASIRLGVTLFGTGTIPLLINQLNKIAAPPTSCFLAIAATSVCSRRLLPAVPPSGE